MNHSRHSRLRSICAGLYCWLHILVGSGVIVWMTLHWQSHDRPRLISYLLSGIVAAVLKVRLPGVTGAASASFLFVIIGIVDLSLPEAIAIACLSGIAQSTFRTLGRPRPIQVCFSVSSIAIAVYVSVQAYNFFLGLVPEPAALGLLAIVFHFTNVFPVAGIIALTESLSPWTIFKRNGWLLPYYAGATSLAWLIGTMPRAIQWEVPIICLPVVYLVHRSYRTYLLQMGQEKKHVEELNTLHMRTIETLALAIDAKDHTTHNHLQRVQLYSLEVGKELGLTGEEIDALKAASVLHDIGKLAVPEHIISKPGKLTPAEFQKMKIHPVVGAEILERVAFPYPVVPIVRSHHEKWDGSGYPDGLAGEQIPIGARILAAVDCLDALASDRQYRRALPLDEAMAKVAKEAGTSFDPAVVEVLRRRYRELESKARELDAGEEPALSTNICITRGAAPAAGFETEATRAPEPAGPPERSVLPALQGLTLEEELAVAAVRIKRVIAYDAVAFYVRDGEVLRSAFAAGSHCGGLGGLNVPVGMGLVGWVAEASQPIINGNPTVEPGYTREEASGALRSALAIPVLDSSNRTLAVLAVYRCDMDAFSSQQVNALMAVSRPLAQTMELKESDTRRAIFAKLSGGPFPGHFHVPENVAAPGVH